MLLRSEGLAEFHLEDCVGFCHQLNSQEVRPAIIFADPPFNQNVPYLGTDDNMPDDVYLDWTYGWMSAAALLLPSNGSLWINIPDRWAANVVCFGRDDLGLTLENWCLWHYRFGQCQPKRFINSKAHALWFSKGEPIVNPETALVPSDRWAIYNDARGTPDGRMDLDIWGFDQYWGRVQGNNKERRPLHENQLPEKYMERIIRLNSGANYTTVDLFCGSGTFATVANKLGRFCKTCDISEAYLHSAADRCHQGTVRV